MKTFVNIVITCLFVVGGLGMVNAQDENTSVSDVDIRDRKNENLNLISSGTITKTSASIPQKVPVGNAVYIQQIGQGNVINSDVASSQSEVNLSQNGNNNTIDVNLSAASIAETIVQNGDNNSAVDYVNDPNAEISLQLNQNGNNTFERYGVNSKTKNIQVNQSSGSRGIIVRSFK